ncbi:MAG: AAA family ATPase [Solirubrobacteraceae bacterium]|nr:AAA family ATPase [Solirubrobacteraceae bacterium]
MDLLERDDELAIVDEMLASAAAGEGRFLLIEGPAGIGKSQVLAEVRRRAGSRMRVLSARGGELEGAFPFGVVRQLFEAVVGDPELRPIALDGAAAPAGDVLGAPTGNTQAGNASFAVLHGLYWLAQNLADDKPIVLTVDDVHWVDRPSLRYLAYLLRRLEGAPILVAATLRSSETGVDEALLGEIAADPVAEPLQPRALSAEAVAVFVRERLGDEPDEEFAAACHRATGGNPLLLRQLLVALAADKVAPRADRASMVTEVAPRAVSRTVLLRLARLPEEAGAVARATAVLGEQATPEAIAALAGIDATALGEVTRALVRAEILDPEPPLGFVHPLVRDAIYQEISPAERELLHASAADALRSVGAPVGHIANQLLRTPPRGEAWVVDTLAEAGHEAIARGAPDGAVAYFQRALDEPPAPELQPGLMATLGVMEAQTSGPLAVEHLRQVHDAAEDPFTQAGIAQVLARTLIFTGDPEAAAEVATAARDVLPDTPETRDMRLGLEACRATAVVFGAGDPSQLEGLAEHRHPPEDAGLGELLLGAIAVYVWAQTDGTAEECCAAALDLLRDGRLTLAADPLIAPSAFGVLQFAAHDGAQALWERERAEGYRMGSLLLTSTIHSWYAGWLMRRGDLAQAREQFETGRRQFLQWGYSREIQAVSDAHLVVLLTEQGELERADELLSELVLPERDQLGTFLRGYAEAVLRLAQGDPERVLALCDDLDSRSTWVTRRIDYPWPAVRALALDRLGRTDEAIPVAEAWLEEVRSWGAPGEVGMALRILGVVQRDDGLPRLEEAVEVLEGSSARLERAKALAALGSAMRRARKPTESREPLRVALDLAAACEAGALVEHVRAELAASGARPRTDALAGVESLTPSERRVVDLAAAGSANREIAQQLYVTPKTVEVHLTNAYRKLGIRSRHELSAALTSRI